MGLFGFGKKKRQSEEAAEAAAEENDKADEAISETAEAPAGGIQETILPEPSDEYDGRGDEHGPWDVDDENVPDYDEYLDMGAYYLPFLQGIELRVKANRATQQVLGTTITYGSSSVSNGLTPCFTPSSLMYSNISNPYFFAVSSRNWIISLNFHVVLTCKNGNGGFSG